MSGGEADSLPIRAERVVVPEAWRAGLARLALAWGLLLAVFHADWQAMAHQWWDSSTYHHILLVPLIIGWLVSQRLPALWSLPVALWKPALALLGACLLLWVMGALAGVAQVTQGAAVAMLAACVPLMLGVRATAGLAFPLAYMGFLVPFGDEAVPFLQMLTARITVALVHVSAVPAQIDGVFISTPAGLFEVAEACSGVKFLVAMLAFGALAAHVCFLDGRRRAAFMALCVVAPVLANGVRAWGTVYVAQYVGRAVAGGVDHIIYGWVFFASVIAGILALGWRYFDRPVGGAMVDVDAIMARPLLARWEGASLSPRHALGGLAAMALLAQGWALAADRLVAPVPAHIDLPEVSGWHRVDYAPRHWWEPRAGGADHRLLGRYANAQGQQVDVFFALYGAQGTGRKASGFGEGALPPQSGWSWQSPEPSAPDAHVERLQADGPVERIAATTYRSGGVTTGSGLRLRLANFTDRLLLRRQVTMMLILSAEDGEGEQAKAAVAAFREAIGPLGLWMDRVAQVDSAQKD